MAHCIGNKTEYCEIEQLIYVYILTVVNQYRMAAMPGMKAVTKTPKVNVIVFFNRKLML